MKAIILAAGYGTRLGSLTKNKPKCLMKIGHKAVIEHIIDNLHTAGISEIIVNTHYLPDKVISRLKSNVLYFYEPRLLGHTGTIKSLQEWLENDDFFVINGDTISNVDYLAMYKKHEDMTITALMDEWRCAGVWLYSPYYFLNSDIPIIPYRPKGLKWKDMGMPQRLKEARRMFT